METRCVACVLNPIVKYIYLSRLFITKCSHRYDGIHLEKVYSYPHILTNIIFAITTILKLLQASYKILNEISSIQSEIDYIGISVLFQILCVSLLIVNKDMFELESFATDTAAFSEKCSLNLMHKSDLMKLDFYAKIGRLLILFNPVSIVWCIDYIFFDRDSILNQLSMIWIIYFLSALGSYGNIVMIYHKILCYNLFKSLKFVLSEQVFTCKLTFELKIKMIKILTGKLYRDIKKFEMIIIPITVAVVVLFPVAVMIIVISILNELLNENSTFDFKALNFLLTVCYMQMTYFLLLINIDKIQEPVSILFILLFLNVF